MKFIEEFDKKYEERNVFIISKTKQVADYKDKVEEVEAEFEKANKEYFLKTTDETLTSLKAARKKLTEVQGDYKDSTAELSQLERNFLFIYDTESLISECKQIYEDSGIDKDVEKVKKLEAEIAKLRGTIGEKWIGVDEIITNATGRINKLYLSDQERIILAGKIDGYARGKLWELLENGFSASHADRHLGELKQNSMEKKQEEAKVSYRGY